MSTTSLTGRDLAVVQLVARFKQVSASQLKTLLFSSHASPTPAARTLNRLVRDNYLHRIERRTVGGARGGSGQYAYALGRKGFFMYFEGRYSPLRTVNYHALAVVDSYVAIRSVERAGGLSVVGLSTEPECWAVINRIELRPDMYVELERQGTIRKLWIEQDQGTEGQRHINAKLDAYRRAYNGADIEEWPVFPGVWWIAIDEERAKELRWLVSQQPAGGQQLHRVMTLQELPAMLA